MNELELQKLKMKIYELGLLSDLNAARGFGSVETIDEVFIYLDELILQLKNKLRLSYKIKKILKESE